MEEKEQRSLDLDLDTVGRGVKAYEVARIAVVGPHACTRDGSADTVTADCRTLPALEREVARLQSELDDALQRAAESFGQALSPDAKRPVRKDTAEPTNGDRGDARIGIDLVVRDVMSAEVVTVSRNDPLSAAREKLDNGGFRHLVVVDEDGEVAGVLSRLDLVFNSLAWSLGASRRGYESALERVPVKEAMHSDPIQVDPSTPLAQAARTMVEAKVSCLPVIDAEALVGIVTDSDLLARIG